MFCKYPADYWVYNKYHAAFQVRAGISKIVNIRKKLLKKERLAVGSGTDGETDRRTDRQTGRVDSWVIAIGI